MNLDLFKDKKSLVFINSEVEFMSMKTDEDFTSLEDFEIIDENGLITYQSEKITTSWNMDKFSIVENDWSKYDLMVEVSFQKLTYENLKEINKSFSTPKKIIGLKLMTFEVIDTKTKKDYNPEDKKIEKIETLVIKPKRILERKIENGTYDLGSLIKEFKRDGKLNDLGI
jgi:hypothetical protein